MSSVIFFIMMPAMEREAHERRIKDMEQRFERAKTYQGNCNFYAYVNLGRGPAEKVLIKEIKPVMDEIEGKQVPHKIYNSDIVRVKKQFQDEFAKQASGKNTTTGFISAAANYDSTREENAIKTIKNKFSSTICRKSPNSDSTIIKFQPVENHERYLKKRIDCGYGENREIDYYGLDQEEIFVPYEAMKLIAAHATDPHQVIKLDEAALRQIRDNYLYDRGIFKPANDTLTPAVG